VRSSEQSGGLDADLRVLGFLAGHRHREPKNVGRFAAFENRACLEGKLFRERLAGFGAERGVSRLAGDELGRDRAIEERTGRGRVVGFQGELRLGGVRGGEVMEETRTCIGLLGKVFELVGRPGEE
jgi:hypothetical protein